MSKAPAATMPMTAYQQRILTVPERHDLALLGARGSGKSTALALLILKHVEAYRGNARVLVVRRQHHGVQHIHSICLRLFQQAYPAMSSTTQPATIRAHGSLTEFNQIDSTADLSKYLGGNYSLICCDQADEYPDPNLLDLLRSLLRTSADVPVRFVICANAGNIGSAWIRARFLVPGAKPWQPFIEADSQRSFVVTRSLLADNKFLPQAEYKAQLVASAAGNAMRLRQWFDDDWDTVLDGMFADVWDRHVHVLEPFAIPGDWKITRSFDWGDSRPFSVGWWATSDGTPVMLRNGDQRTFPRNTMIGIAEWYGWTGKPNQGLRLHSSGIAKGVFERERTMDIHHRVRSGPADSSIYDQRDGNSIAAAMALPPYYVTWLPAYKGPGSRMRGWANMREMLVASTRNDGAGLYVFDTCVQFLRTVPVAPRDPVNPDDVDTDYEDHACDQSRYATYRKVQVATITEMSDGWGPSPVDHRDERRFALNEHW